jgi:hypothetical protein
LVPSEWEAIEIEFSGWINEHFARICVMG